MRPQVGPQLLHIEELRTMVEINRTQTVRGVAEELGASSYADFEGLEPIGKVKKLEQCDLNDRQKLSCFEVCSCLLLLNEIDPISDCTVILD